MKFVIRPRQGGKTHATVQWLREDPDRRVIIAHSAATASDLRRRYDLTERQVVTVDSIRTRERGRRAEYAVENLDIMLPYLLGTGPNPVSMVTATGESA